MTGRRAFLAGAITALAAPVAGRAQNPGKAYRVGFLSPSFTPTPARPQRTLEAFRQRLRELGYVDGKDLIIERRYADGDPGRLPSLAAELVHLSPDVIVAQGSTATLAAKKATSTIPIVMGGSMDPIRDGIVTSLMRPGENVTGMTQISDADLIAKRLQLLKEVVPHASHLAIVPPPRPLSRAAEVWVKDAEMAGKALGLTVEALELKDPSQWNDVFGLAVAKRFNALYPIEYAAFTSHAKHIAEVALKHRIPTVHSSREFVEFGSLLSYGDNVVARWRRAAELVDKVLRGTKPADIPVEQSTKFELVINLKTAKALGLTIPAAALARADELIE